MHNLQVRYIFLDIVIYFLKIKFKLVSVLPYFRTPPYKNPEIESNVDVFFELYRPTASSNGSSTSESFKFTYHPDPNQVGYSSSMSSVNIKLITSLENTMNFKK